MSPLPQSYSAEQWKFRLIAALSSCRSHRVLRHAAFVFALVLQVTAAALHAAPGDVDASFDPNVGGTEVRALAVQPDGKVIVGGVFSSVAGVARTGLARLHADGTLDAGFNPVLDNNVSSVAVQPDGRILVGGPFTSVGGTPRNCIARLRADGTLDASFNPGADASVTTFVVQPDGKIIVGGFFATVAGTARNRIARLHSNGALDTSFNPDVNDLVGAMALQANGKILLGGRFTAIGGVTRRYIAQLNADGTLDTGFAPEADFYVFAMAVQADGRILVGGGFTTIGGAARNHLARLLSSGALDTSFDPNPDDWVLALSLQANGSILVGGGFGEIGGATRHFAARLNSSGAIDANFNPDADNAVESLAVQADGKILLGGFFNTIGGVARNYLARLENDGAPGTLAVSDASRVLWSRGGTAPEVSHVLFELSTNAGATWVPLGVGTRAGVTANWQLTGLSLPANGLLRARGRTAGGRYGGSAGLIEQVAAFPLPGAPDTTYNPNLSAFLVALAVQADGKAVVGGVFSSVGGAMPTHIARLQADGTLDGSFIPSVQGLNIPIWSLAVQVDGKILLGGDFYQVNGVARSRLARLQPDGTLDTGFNPNVVGTLGDAVSSFALQGDGKILFGGRFTSVSGATRNNIARLLSDGTLDANYDPNANDQVWSVALQPDGRAIIGGSFTTVGAVARNRLARLNVDGTLDPAFNPDAGAIVRTLAVQPDGKTIIGGDFTTVGSTPRNYIARLNVDGTLDVAFNPNANGRIRSVALQTDGKIFIAGEFTTVGGTPRGGLVRLHADGSVDTSFNLSAPFLNGVAIQADGKILAFGNYFWRFQNNAASSTISTPDSTQLLWSRAGAAPEVARVTFELSSDGGANWTPIGTGTRIGATSNWQLTNLALPATGSIRARGWTTSGNANGSAGLIEQITTLAPEIAVEQPASNGLIDGAAQVSIGTAPVGSSTATKSFTIRNVGASNLTGLSVNKDGTHAGDFSVDTSGMLTTLPGGGSTTFTVTCTPSGSGIRTAAIHIASSDTDENPFDITITGAENVEFPTLSLPSSPVSAEATGANGAAVAFTVTASDAEDGPLIPVVSPLSGSTFALGDTTVNVWATDSDGWSTSGNFIVRVRDTTPPVITLVGANPLTVDQGDPFLDPGATAADAVSGILTSSIVAAGSVDTNTLGTYARTYNVTDTSGNAAIQRTRTVNVVIPRPGFAAIAYNPNLVGNFVYATAIQPDGKAVIGGRFTSVGGTVRNRIARLHTDGTLDLAFNPNANGDVHSLVIQADGKILVVGNFTAVGGVTRSFLARLQADGTFDTSFTATTNGLVRNVAVQADGMIVFGGDFTTVGGVARNRIARLHADGALDTAFDPNAAGGSVHSLAIQADGKILLGGGFSTVSGATHRKIARLNTDGTRDASFNPEVTLGSSFATVYCVALQADGKILLGGDFSGVNATTRTNLARLHADGTLDISFGPSASSYVYSIAVQADGRMLIGGQFGDVSGTQRLRIARLNANGTLDTAFNPFANGDVRSLALQADGKILAGGSFTSIGGATRALLARLHNDAAIATLSAPDQTQTLWSRGGASPDLSQVTFDLSIDGGTTWSPLGNGSRVSTTAHWQISGLSLPAGGSLRARGRTSGGLSNGSSGLIESTVAFTFSPDSDHDGLLDSWELAYWPTIAGHDADDDFDQDGLSELEELGFGLNPIVPDAASAPAVGEDSGYLTITISKRTGASYAVQSAGTLLDGQPDSFSVVTTTVLIDNATTLKVRDNFPISASPSRFVRVVVTAAP